MQENEIFVGAYVIALGRVRKIKAIVKKDTGVEVSFEGKNPVIVSLDILRPVPLSVEIMEKNFHGVTRGSGCLMSHEYNIKEDYFISADAGDFYLCIRVDDSEYGYHDVIYLKELKWLHQLQQLFTICGIEQEITLDGISVKDG